MESSSSIKKEVARLSRQLIMSTISLSLSSQVYSSPLRSPLPALLFAPSSPCTCPLMPSASVKTWSSTVFVPVHPVFLWPHRQGTVILSGFQFWFFLLLLSYCTWNSFLLTKNLTFASFQSASLCDEHRTNVQPRFSKSLCQRLKPYLHPEVSHF